MDRIVDEAYTRRTTAIPHIRRPLWLCAVGALLLRCACGPVLAEETPAVLSGGIGSDERAQVQARRADFNLRLAFANDKGEYVSAVAVHIDALRDGQHQRVYDAQSVGPLFYAHLAPGKYRLELVYRGTSRVLEHQVGAQQKTPEIVVRWPAAD